MDASGNAEVRKSLNVMLARKGLPDAASLLDNKAIQSSSAAENEAREVVLMVGVARLGVQFGDYDLIELIDNMTYEQLSCVVKLRREEPDTLEAIVHMFPMYDFDVCGELETQTRHRKRKRGCALAGIEVQVQPKIVGRQAGGNLGLLSACVVG